MNAILFINYTDEDFSHSWGGVNYNFKAGTSMYLEPYLAEHFAKHLTNREINRLNRGVPPEKEIRIDNQQLRNTVLSRCIRTVETEATGTAQLATELLNMNIAKDVAEVKLEAIEPKKFCDSCESKGVRHRKECPKYVSINPKKDAASSKE